MYRSLGTVPAIICASAFLIGIPCFGQTSPPPSTPPSGPVVVGEKPSVDPPPPATVAPAAAVPTDTPPATAPTGSTDALGPRNPVIVPPTEVGDPAKPPISVQPVSPAHTLPAKDASAAYAAGAKPYVIGSLDVLDIKVWNAPNLSGFFEVGPDGMISMPLIGEIRGDGVTKEEITKTIREKLASAVFTEPPEVNVQVARVNSKKYYIFGGVNRPGEFPLLGSMTVLDAFATAGGFHDFANKKNIYILRENPKAKGGIETLKFNFNDVSKGKHMEQNIQLQNGDRIFVKE